MLPIDSRFGPRPRTLEHWLTERYCLYAEAPDGAIWRNEVHHQPWPLQSAAVEIERNTLLQTHGIAIHEPPTHLHFARRLDVVVWNGERVALLRIGSLRPATPVPFTRGDSAEQLCMSQRAVELPL